VATKAYLYLLSADLGLAKKYAAKPKGKGGIAVSLLTSL